VFDFVPLHVSRLLAPCCDVRYDFRVKHFFMGGSKYIYVICIVFIYGRLVSIVISISDDVRVISQ
jgi:hypothetical protein